MGQVNSITELSKPDIIKLVDCLIKVLMDNGYLNVDGDGPVPYLWDPKMDNSVGWFAFAYSDLYDDRKSSLRKQVINEILSKDSFIMENIYNKPKQTDKYHRLLEKLKELVEYEELYEAE